MLCDISDHYQTFCSISLIGSVYHRPQVLTYKIRIINQTCRDNFLEKLSNVKLDTLTQTDYVNELTPSFLETVQQMFFECFPIITRNHKKKDIDKPYITPHIM